MEVSVEPQEEPLGVRSNTLNYMFLTAEEALRMHGGFYWESDDFADIQTWGRNSEPEALPCPPGVLPPEDPKQEEQALPCCFVCFHQDPSVAFLCGHVVCKQCYQAWYSQRSWKCWLCRKPVQGSLRLFYSSLDEEAPESEEKTLNQ